MGILRADRITGLGGADAIKGSVFFGGGGGLVSPESDDFKFCAGGDFTIEAWVNTFEFGNAAAIVACWDQSGVDGSGEGGDCWLLNINTSGVLQLAWSPHATDVYFITGGTLTKDTWHHVAVTRNGNTFRIFLDGTQTATGTNSSTNNANSELFIGRYGSHSLDYYWHGNISNVRILKGEALYTSTFTPPNRELTVTPNTVLVACQSPGNISREATGKHLSIIKKNVNDAPPVASSFTPNSPVGFSTTSDVGSQYGSTFNGFGNFATSTYMVPPGGNTRERNRGRGIFADGDQSTDIEFVNIQSMGNSQEFGDSTTIMKQRATVGSSTRAVTAGGFDSPAFTNIIDFITIANTANATDFGDILTAKRNMGGAGNNTRGIYLGGGSPDNTNTIEFITIATAGNAQDFGDATAAKSGVGSLASPTRACFGGGQDNTIEFVTIATTGNASDFGDLISGTTEKPAGTSSSTRGLFICGESQPSGTRINTIQFITIASTGNATDFGDHTDNRRSFGACNNSIRAVYGGGNTSSATVNSLSFVTIATTGDGQDFGDLLSARSTALTSTSDSHGGIS